MSKVSHALGDDALDRYARMVQRSLAVPVGLVSMVEATRQVFVGARGLPEPWQESRQTPLTHSFCQYVVKDDRPLVIPDARLDDRLADNLAIPDLGVVAYAGWPIQDHTGRTVGSLCAIDSEPRAWTRDELDALADIAAACTAELSERGQREAAVQALEVAEELGERSRLLLAISDRIAATASLADIAAAVDEVTRTELGCTSGAVWLRDGDLDALARPPAPGDPLRLVPADGVTTPLARAGRTLDVGSAGAVGACLTDCLPRYQRDRLDAADETARPTAGARAALPLTLGGTTYGALELTWPIGRSFTRGDRRTLAALTTYTAQAVQTTQLLHDRVHAAVVLQEAMLTRLPTPPGLELAARYLPASTREQVGGDWYDALAIPGRGTSLVIGDVSGHDIAAAAVMGQLRSMLRVLDWREATTPAATLTDLDRAMEGLGTHTVASAVLARVAEPDDDPSARHRVLEWASAGHPPPLLIGPDGQASLLGAGTRGDLLLGVDSAAVRHDHRAEVADGSLLVLYTDGLVERRGERLDAGLSRLTNAAVAAATERDVDGSVDGFVDHLLDAMVGTDTGDDIALLAVRFLPHR